MSDTQKKIAAWLTIYGITVYIVLTFANNFYRVDDSFESVSEGAVPFRWYYTGTLPVAVDYVPEMAKDGDRVARLRERVEPAHRSQREHTLLYRTMVIPNYDRPVLTFWYRIFANDTVDFSNFWVYVLRDGTLEAEIKRDGYRCCERDPVRAPPEGHDLEWRMASYDLNELRGETVTLVFQVNNLYTDSLGIWTYVDDVRVEAGPTPTPTGSHRAYLPLVMKGYATCDTLPTPVSILGVEVMPTALPTRPPTPIPEPP